MFATTTAYLPSQVILCNLDDRRPVGLQGRLIFRIQAENPNIRQPLLTSFQQLFGQFSASRCNEKALRTFGLVANAYSFAARLCILGACGFPLQRLTKNYLENSPKAG